MTLSLQEIEETVHGLVLEESDMHKPVERLAFDFDLIGGGVLDSIGIFRVLTAIEEEYGISVPDDDIRLEKVETIRAIARLIEDHLDGADS